MPPNSRFGREPELSEDTKEDRIESIAWRGTDNHAVGTSNHGANCPTQVTALLRREQLYMMRFNPDPLPGELIPQALWGGSSPHPNTQLDLLEITIRAPIENGALTSDLKGLGRVSYDFLTTLVNKARQAPTRLLSGLDLTAQLSYVPQVL